MIAKIHRSKENKLILAVCDSNLLGKRFEENELQLDLTTQFYNGKEVLPADLKRLCLESDIINLVGAESVEFALKEKIIDKKNIVRIKNIPHAQAIMIREEE